MSVAEQECRGCRTALRSGTRHMPRCWPSAPMYTRHQRDNRCPRLASRFRAKRPGIPQMPTEPPHKTNGGKGLYLSRSSLKGCLPWPGTQTPDNQSAAIGVPTPTHTPARLAPVLRGIPVLNRSSTLYARCALQRAAIDPFDRCRTGITVNDPANPSLSPRPVSVARTRHTPSKGNSAPTIVSWINRVERSFA